MRTLEYATINLLDTPSYNFTANCFEQTLSGTITWSSREQKRCITIIGANGKVYLQNTFLNIDEPLEFNINAVDDDFKCSLVLQLQMEAEDTLDYLNWSRNMFMTVYRLT